MAKIQISSEDVKMYASQIDAYNQEIQTLFNEIKAKIYYVESIWKSPASENFLRKFQSLHPTFDSYVNTMDRFSKYLHQTSLAYQENEQALNQSFNK